MPFNRAIHFRVTRIHALTNIDILALVLGTFVLLGGNGGSRHFPHRRMAGPRGGGGGSLLLLGHAIMYVMRWILILYVHVPQREQRARPDTQGRRSAGQCCAFPGQPACIYLLISLNSFALSPRSTLSRSRSRSSVVGWCWAALGWLSYEPRILRTLCVRSAKPSLSVDSHLAIVPDPPRTKLRSHDTFRSKTGVKAMTKRASRTT